MEHDRRDFLKLCLTAGALGTLTYLGIGCSKSGKDNPAGPAAGATYALNLANYPALAADNSAVSVTGTPLPNRPLIVTHVSGDEYHALDSTCTHQACTVPASMRCPCHGSVYNLSGGNVSGPAPRPLTSYQVTKDGNTLTVHF